MTQDHAKGKVPSIPDFTTINRKINRLDIRIKDTTDSSKEFKDEYIIIAIDRYCYQSNKQRPPMDARQMAYKK